MKKSPIFEWLARKPIWPFNVAAIGVGPIFLRDFSSLATAYPSWAGPIELLPHLVGAVFVGSVVGLVIVEVARSKTRESYKELMRRAERAQALEDTVAENITEIINGIILGFSAKLGLQQDDNSRISLYVEDSTGNLINVGRVATNPNHKPVGRKVLPKDKGCVGKAWGDGWAFVPNFSEENYGSHAGHFGMTAEQIAGLKMKPLFIAALRIDDGPRSLAILVFESLQENRFDETKIRKEMSAFIGYLTGTLITLTPHLPKPLSGIGREL